MNMSTIREYGYLTALKDIKGRIVGSDGQLILKKNGGIVNGASC